VPPLDEPPLLFEPLFDAPLLDSSSAASPESCSVSGTWNTTDPTSTSMRRMIARASCACSTWSCPAVLIRQ
jgi:hypothetical protein